MNKNIIHMPDNESDVDNTDFITKEQLIGCLPDKRFKRAVSDEIVDLVNSEPESELRRLFRDNTLTFSSVLSSGRYSLAAYVRAVKFVSLKLLGDGNSLAYAKVFPERYQNLVSKGTSSSQIASFADNYSKNSLVIKIMEQTIVPTHILNAGIYQEAINTQADLMRTAKSEMVRQKAAESLITNLKAPEAAKVEIDINYSSNMIDDLRSTTRALAQQQKELIKQGVATAADVAGSDIIAKKLEPEVTYIDVTPEEPEPEPSHVSAFEGF